jgi:hypothetical protein
MPGLAKEAHAGYRCETDAGDANLIGIRMHGIHPFNIEYIRVRKELISCH